MTLTLRWKQKIIIWCVIAILFELASTTSNNNGNFNVAFLSVTSAFVVPTPTTTALSTTIVKRKNIRISISLSSKKAQPKSISKELALVSMDSSITNATISKSDIILNTKDSNTELELAEVDVLYGSRTPLVYDPSFGRYISKHDHDDDHHDENVFDSITNSSINNGKKPKRSRIRNKVIRKVGSYVKPRIKSAFIPEGVYPSYYKYVGWRIFQRFVNANLQVLGTQSLLLGLGLKTKRLGLSAALNWVLKDALGKITRMAWAGKMGRKFDSDAKRWRFRSSLMYSFGNFLEIITYVFPQLFLLWATVANCCKQMSMLTSSSTRTAIYNSFRDGTRENIGDIVAKGEAQIAVVDLVGIASGVCLSRLVGMSTKSILLVYFLLQSTEIFCMYNEIRAVEFRVLNFERMVQAIDKFVQSHGKDVDKLPTPTEMAKKEMVFLPTKHLQRRGIAFGSLGRAKLSPDEVKSLLDIFKHEKYLMVVGTDVKNKHPLQRLKRVLCKDNVSNTIESNCHIVLHRDATNVDIVKSTLALCILRRKLHSLEANALGNNATSSIAEEKVIRSRDCMDLIRDAELEAEEKFSALLKAMAIQGWAAPGRFMFGRVTKRAEWPIEPRVNVAYQDDKAKHHK